MVTMEIGILVENTEEGIFLDYGVQLLEDWPEWGAPKGSSGKPGASRRHGMLWESVKVPSSASGVS